VVAVYLFGSVAKGTARAESDVDIGVLYDTPRPARLMTQPFDDEAALAERLARRVQVIGMNDAPPDLAFYLGPTLFKLGRHREALAVFLASTAPRDALTDFYLGQTYYQLKLYRKARALFVALRARGLGPVLDGAAARYVAMVDATYAKAPGDATIDYYVELGAETVRAPDQALVAAEIFDEARLVEALAAAPHRHAEIGAGLGAAWNAAGRPRAVIDALADDRARSPDGSWELARAYVATGDAARARPLLDALIRGGGARARDAAALRAGLPR